jgi:hypothetical protein
VREMQDHPPPWGGSRHLPEQTSQAEARMSAARALELAMRAPRTAGPADDAGVRSAACLDAAARTPRHNPNPAVRARGHGLHRGRA